MSATTSVQAASQGHPPRGWSLVRLVDLVLEDVAGFARGDLREPACGGSVGAFRAALTLAGEDVDGGGAVFCNGSCTIAVKSQVWSQGLVDVGLQFRF